MKLCVVRIPCRELEKSLDYYSHKLGLEVVFGSVSDSYIGLAIENAQIILEPEEAGEFESGRYLGFSVSVPDLDAQYNEMSARGVQFTGPPERQSWGGSMTHIIDPNGNSFSVIQA